jgi:hypothetical protein
MGKSLPSEALAAPRFEVHLLPRPGLALQKRNCLGSNRWFLQPDFQGSPLQQVSRKIRNVLVTHNQWRQGDGDGTQSIKKFFPELPFPDGCLKVPVRSRQDPHVDRNLVISSD